jgi:hypothetical protein
MGNDTSIPNQQTLNEQEMKNRDIQKLDMEMKMKMKKGINYNSKKKFDKKK